MHMNSSFLGCHPRTLLNVGVFRMGEGKMKYWSKSGFHLLIMEYLKHSFNMQLGKGPA